MKVTGVNPPNTLFSNRLIYMYCECGSHADARKVFDRMVNRNLFSWNNMLSGYCKLGMVKPARKLFDKMVEKDVVSWNMMVIGYAQSGVFYEALRIYKEFRRLGIGYSEFSFSGVLTVCVKLKELGLTRQVHCQVYVAGFLNNVVLGSSVADAYAKCGEMAEARLLFDEMPRKDVFAWTTLVSGYALWGQMKLARKLFEEMPQKNSVPWTALIAGYAKNGLGYEALELFTEMMVQRVKPDQFTFSSCLCACAGIASLKHGKQVHACLVRTNFRPNVIVVSSLIDMYSKCGSLEAGQRVFESMDHKQDPMMWNTMISALAQHGLGERAIELFYDLVKSGVKPDRITFVVILNACSHSGLVPAGLHLFESMTRDFRISPDQEHYACLIDLLGRAGCFSEVITQLRKMPLRPDSRVWNSLLGVCRIHGNIELGRKAAEHLIELEPQSSAAYVLLSSTYAALGRWESVANVRKLMDERHVRKDRAVCWLEVENKVHAFTVSDRSHPLTDEIYSVLENLVDHMEDDDSLLDAREEHLLPSLLGGMETQSLACNILLCLF